MASLFTDRAIVYRRERGYAHRAVALSVGVQKMVRSHLSCAGVMFTLDTESSFRDVVEISGAWGLGASSTLRDGDLVTVSCAEGDEGRVYAGEVPFVREVIDPATLPHPPLPVMLNVGNPENAFLLGQLPSAALASHGSSSSCHRISGFIRGAARPRASHRRSCPR